MENAALAGFVSFMVVGAQKAGTTTLHAWLAAEDDLSLPRMKETHYFSDPARAIRGADWYRACFDPAGRIRGEVDPDYLSAPGASRRIRETLGDIRIAVVLREPLRRSYSQYLMSVRRGIEKRSFKQALEEEAASREAGVAVADDFDYLGRSLYAEHLREYIATFTRVQVVRFEDLFEASADQTGEATYAELVRFLTGEDDRVVRRDASVRENSAARPKSSTLAAAIWDPERFQRFRGVARALVPSQAARELIRRRADAWNRSRSVEPAAIHGLEPLSSNTLNLLKDDIAATEELTRLDLSSWRTGLASR